MTGSKRLILVLICALMSACSTSKPSPPLLTESEVEVTSTSASIAATTTATNSAPEPTDSSSTPATSGVDSGADGSEDSLSLTPTTVSATRKPQTGLDAKDPALAQEIRRQVNEYHLAYFNEYLKLPNGDISSMVRFAAPNSASARTILEDAKTAKAKDLRARRPESGEVFVLDTGRITAISATRVQVASCQANNLVAYYFGPPESVIEDRLVTIISVDDYVLIDGKWLEETQRSRDTYEGQQCELLPR